MKKNKAAAKAIGAGVVLGRATLAADGMFVGAGEVVPRTGAGNEAVGAMDAEVAFVMVDGAGVAEVGTSSMTATKSSPPKALVSPHDPSVTPAKITLRSHPAAMMSKSSSPVDPSC